MLTSHDYWHSLGYELRPDGIHIPHEKRIFFLLTFKLIFLIGAESSGDIDVLLTHFKFQSSSKDVKKEGVRKIFYFLVIFHNVL